MRVGRRASRLVCPSCGLAHPARERFCRACGMPLTHSRDEAVEPPPSEARQRARMVDPAFTQGELVCVAGARHLAEAELIQGLLLEHGVPSMVRRSAGFDVPDFLAAGPRDVLVPASGAQVARELLSVNELAPAGVAEPAPGLGRALVLALAVLIGGALTALAAWLLQGAA